MRQHPGSALPESEVPSGTACAAAAETGAVVGSSSSSKTVTFTDSLAAAPSLLPPDAPTRGRPKACLCGLHETVQTRDSRLRGRISQKRR
jgi:hypothetical protein